MITFPEWLSRKAAVTVPWGDGERTGTIVAVSNNQVAFMPTHDKTGATLPATDLMHNAPVVPNANTPNNAKFVPVSAEPFDALWAEYNATVAVLAEAPVLSDESIAAGATLADMANATDADKQHIRIIQQLRAALTR